MSAPHLALLPDGRRLHLQHGPIDLILSADGDLAEVRLAYGQAWQAFQTVLANLVAELDLLRAPCSAGGPVPAGKVAARMHAACMPHSARFITPMAAVAGAVADHVLASMICGRNLRRAFVNNGGDMAISLAGDAEFRIGLCADPVTGAMIGHATIRGADPVRGIATSGWRGRSFSFGIADVATVLAADAATADAAATMIANAADPGECPAIRRQPASQLAPDSDLGDREVTVDVGELTPRLRLLAAERAQAAAQSMVEDGRIVAALIVVQGEIRMAGRLDLVPASATIRHGEGNEEEFAA